MDVKLDSKKVERISKALGDPHRLRIMEAIKKEEDWMQCSAIIDMFNISQSTVSHHVHLLLDAELLLIEKDGRNAKYKINKETFNSYMRYLSNLAA